MVVGRNTSRDTSRNTSRDISRSIDREDCTSRSSNTNSNTPDIANTNQIIKQIQQIQKQQKYKHQRYDNKRKVSMEYKSWAGSKGMLPLQKYHNPMDIESYQKWLIQPLSLSSSSSSSSLAYNSDSDKAQAKALQKRNQKQPPQPQPLDPIIDLKPIYVDEHIVVITKRSGVLSVPGPNRKPNVANLVYTYFGSGSTSTSTITSTSTSSSADNNTDNNNDNNDNNNDNDNVDSMIVHRLDMDTSGIIIYARNKLALTVLHDFFRAKTQSQSINQHNNKRSKQQKQQQQQQSKKKKKKNQDKQMKFKMNNKNENENKNKNQKEEEQQQQKKLIIQPQLVTKTYEALVCGHMNTMEGEINYPLMRDKDHPPFMKVWNGEGIRSSTSANINANINNNNNNDDNDSINHYNKLKIDKTMSEETRKKKHEGYLKMISKAPKESLTQYRILSKEYLVMNSGNNGNNNNDDDDNNDDNDEKKLLPVTRLELIPITGRTHQLRVHCAAIGHPIIGDNIYGFNGDGSPNGGLVNTSTSSTENSSLEVSSTSSSSSSSSTMYNAMKGLYPNMASESLQRDIYDLVIQSRSRKRERCSSGGTGTSDIEFNGNLCLHARKLCLQHPITKAPMCFEADPPF